MPAVDRDWAATTAKVVAATDRVSREAEVAVGGTVAAATAVPTVVVEVAAAKVVATAEAREMEMVEGMAMVEVGKGKAVGARTGVAVSAVAMGMVMAAADREVGVAGDAKVVVVMETVATVVMKADLLEAREGGVTEAEIGGAASSDSGVEAVKDGANKEVGKATVMEVGTREKMEVEETADEQVGILEAGMAARRAPAKKEGAEEAAWARVKKAEAREMVSLVEVPTVGATAKEPMVEEVMEIALPAVAKAVTMVREKPVVVGEEVTAEAAREAWEGLAVAEWGEVVMPAAAVESAAVEAGTVVVMAARQPVYSSG